MKKKSFTSSTSRLDRVANNNINNDEHTIAGRIVSKIETDYKKKKVDAVKTSIKIPKDLKEKTQILANLKQVSWTALIIESLEKQLKENDQLMNQFSKYNNDNSGINGTNGINGIK